MSATADTAGAVEATRSDREALWIERQFFPSAEDMRMVRSIALLGMLEAAQHGTYRARFRRFQVHAWREPEPADRFTIVRVHICIALEECVLEQTTVNACTASIGEND
jgi:hypothetical protein